MKYAKIEKRGKMVNIRLGFRLWSIQYLIFLWNQNISRWMSFRGCGPVSDLLASTPWGWGTFYAGAFQQFTYRVWFSPPDVKCDFPYLWKRCTRECKMLTHAKQSVYQLYILQRSIVQNLEYKFIVFSLYKYSCWYIWNVEWPPSS